MFDLVRGELFHLFLMYLLEMIAETWYLLGLYEEILCGLITFQGENIHFADSYS